MIIYILKKACNIKKIQIGKKKMSTGDFEHFIIITFRKYVCLSMQYRIQ